LKHGYLRHRVFDTHATFVNLSMSACKDSPFSCFTLRRDIDDVLSGRLVEYYMMNFVVKTFKFPTELAGRSVNQPSGPS